MCSQNFSWLSTVATSLRWLSWISPQRLIRLIMRFFSSVSRQVFPSSALPYSGFGRIFPAERSTFVALQQGQQSATWSVAFRRAQCLAGPILFIKYTLHSRPGCTRVKLRSIPTSLRFTTLRYLVPVRRPLSMICQMSMSASASLQIGCTLGLIVFH